MNEGIWPNEGPQPVTEGDIITYTLTVPYATVSSGTHVVYKNNTDVTAAVLGGAVSVSGNVITCKVMTVPTGYGGSTLVHVIGADCDGQHLMFKLKCPVSKPGQE